MNKNSLFLIIASAMLILMGCEPTVQPMITLSPTSITLNLDDTYTLQTTITPKDVITPITWESSNPDIANVDANGVVTALAAGTTTISASIANAEPAKCIVTVVDNAIMMLTDSVALFVHDTCLLKVKLPACDTTAHIIWTSETPELASVDENGLVTAKAEGTASIALFMSQKGSNRLTDTLGSGISLRTASHITHRVPSEPITRSFRL